MKKLNKNDTVAIVSLSNGMMGDKGIIERYYIAKERLEKDFGLKVKPMKNCLKGSKELYENPKLRADDLMDAFKDNEVKAVICAIGGTDTIRLLPYVDFSVIKNNPKIFMGYSDTTVNHFMLHKAGVDSFYGPSILAEFAENVEMHDYTVKYIKDLLFDNKKDIEITSSPYWTNDFLPWDNKDNNSVKRKLSKETHGIEVLQGSNNAQGKLLGGCIDVFPMFMGTDIWPSKDDWKNKILFIETSEDSPFPYEVEYILRNLGAEGIFDQIKGIIVGKPSNEKYYDEYKESIIKIVANEFGRKDIPILYNVNFGHSSPICILPYNHEVTLDVINKKIIINGKVFED